MLQRPDRPLRLVDIGLPRNIDPGARLLNNVTLYDLDDVHQVIATSKQERAKYIPDAERIIEDELRTLSYRLPRRRDCQETIRHVQPTALSPERIPQSGIHRKDAKNAKKKPDMNSLPLRPLRLCGEFWEGF
jgi:glutamyl-tRNA reductase